ncbi:MAG TPA: M20/M25/M40 family metallo-hydrolase [Steroidobacteraceae bacterium]|nr:M20/M25/M40 family metallo-hydrolase [Steroidobacteraceae bacterium]
MTHERARRSLAAHGCWLMLASSAAVHAQGTSSPSSAPADLPDPRLEHAVETITPTTVERHIESLVSFGTRSTLSAQDARALAAHRGVGAARDWILAQLERYSKDCGGCLEVKTDRFTQTAGERIAQPTVITNVYAVLRGTDPGAAQRIVLVTGHYDSRNSVNEDTTHEAPGANDDASGVAVSLECARVLSRLRFPATIIFLAVAGEEQGLYGSAHFAHGALEQHLALEAVLNNDIVGGDRSAGQDANIVRVFSEGIPATLSAGDVRRIRAQGLESDSASRELARYVAAVAATYRLPIKPLLIFRQDRYLRGGDHASFNEEGFAAVRLTEFRENFAHQHQTPRTEDGVEYGDLLKFVDTGYVARVARLNALVLASLASAPAPPGEVMLLTKQLENDSTLEWQASPGAGGYEVLWRATAAPDWEHAQWVQGTRVTLPVSKDNVVFAVRALDAAGHRSLAVVPAPRR